MTGAPHGFMLGCESTQRCNKGSASVDVNNKRRSDKNNDAAVVSEAVLELFDMICEHEHAPSNATTTPA